MQLFNRKIIHSNSPYFEIIFPRKNLQIITKQNKIKKQLFMDVALSG